MALHCYLNASRVCSPITWISFAVLYIAAILRYWLYFLRAQLRSRNLRLEWFAFWVGFCALFWCLFPIRNRWLEHRALGCRCRYLSALRACFFFRRSVKRIIERTSNLGFALLNLNSLTIKVLQLNLEEISVINQKAKWKKVEKI
jgi:hypothetical protein